MKVLNIGSLNIDYVYTVDDFVCSGETKSAQSLLTNCGGKGLNQSVALARAGLETWHAGIIGEKGRFLADELEQSGVRTGLIRHSHLNSGHAIIQVNRQGQNCILVYPGTNAALTGEYLDSVLSHFTQGDVLLLQNETNMVPEAIEKAYARGMQVAFNASPIGARVKDYPLEKIRWLFVNEIEGGLLSGEQTVSSIIQVLRTRFPRTELVLTLGEKGSIWAGDGGIRRCGACRVNAVDTTAAGDTFTGFFLRGVLRPLPHFSPLKLATVASAMAVTRPGAAQSIPDVQDVVSWSLTLKNSEEC